MIVVLAVCLMLASGYILLQNRRMSKLQDRQSEKIDKLISLLERQNEINTEIATAGEAGSEKIRRLSE